MILKNTPSPYEVHRAQPTEAEAGAKAVLFDQSMTISGLAHVEYGDWREWRRIAEFNDLRDVRIIEPGTPLIIPPILLQSGIYESV